MIIDSKTFTRGLIMLALFLGVLVLLFMPLFNGQNSMQYLDALYNSISKGSAYYIPEVQTETENVRGQVVTLSLPYDNKEQAQQTQMLLAKTGVQVSVEEGRLNIKGDLGQMMEGCLEDADAMYYNDGPKVNGKYGYDERRVLYNWAHVIELAVHELKGQKKFEAAKILDLALEKGVQASYNYYQVEPQSIRERLGVVIVSLLFYVIYTLWYGFAIMYLFEGWGMRLNH